jgi:hypothetical protein
MHEIVETNVVNGAGLERRVPEAVDFGSSCSLANFQDDGIDDAVQKGARRE